MGATSFAKVGATGAAPAFALAPVNTAAAATARVPTSTGTRRFIAPPPDGTSGEKCFSLAYFDAAGTQEAATMVTDVMFTRLTGVALINRPLMMTVWPRCAVRLNSETPIKRY